MSIKKKMFSSLFIFGAVLILSACGENAAPAQEGSKGAVSPQPEMKMEEDQAIAPTGEVEDIVNSVVSDSEAEANQMMSDEEDAYSAVEDFQEVDDLSQSLSQDEL